MKILATFLGLISLNALASPPARYVQIAAKDKFQRSELTSLGVSIEAVRSDSVWGFAGERALRRVKTAGFKVLGNFDPQIAEFDFPTADSRYHNYKELIAALNDLREKNPDLVAIQSIGKSVQGRDLWAIHINSDPDARATGKSGKPGAIYLGEHHAREHLSVEVPLMWAQYLLANRADAAVSKLLDTRDIWVVPMVNPDGAEFDIETGKYAYWRKNRRDNKDGEFGVDLNRNYGYQWGTGGSTDDTSDEVYMGPSPFSEPESQAVRDLVEGLPNTKVLLSFHTFSELILYPWGYSHNQLSNATDLAVFKKMATTMAAWNHYKPEQSSALYIASGDTTDWAYGTHGIFAFTFELSPKDVFSGGFYPGARVIDHVFSDNLKPCLYLLDAADNPYKVVGKKKSSFLTNFVEPTMDESLFWETHPIPRR